nr:unnamed protein product [Digitaria exilis]
MPRTGENQNPRTRMHPQPASPTDTPRVGRRSGIPSWREEAVVVPLSMAAAGGDAGEESGARVAGLGTDLGAGRGSGVGGAREEGAASGWRSGAIGTALHHGAEQGKGMEWDY